MNGSPGINATPRSIANYTPAHDGRVRQLVLTKAGPKAQAGWLAVMGVLSKQANS
ncbi:hypothetical protein [Limnohabitans sp.]|uniref:hypothetical protein n=1 Tax=Limnohabitans sp. TaxID=1907725 RepID=UPI0038B9AEB0